ncbi:MAG TPA: DMT family transporter [Candidatus Competibacteraceae bacterium]|nr:DMT family transporter [Candidatus Competibacteraceae bacterium]
MSSAHHVRGALYLLAAEFLFCCMDALIKFLSTALPSETIVFFRNLLALLLLLPWIARRGGVNMAWSALRFHLLRSASGIAAMYCAFIALAHLPLAETTVLRSTTPLFIPLIAWLWLGEPVSHTARFALALGFLGILLILRPGLAVFSPMALVALTSGLLAAVAMTTIRRLAGLASSSEIVFYFSLMGTLLSLLPLTWGWQTPSAMQLAGLLLMGALATSAQLLLTRAYTCAPAVELAPYVYSTVLFSSLLGWMLWGERLDGPGWLGAALVALAGVSVVRAARWRA